MRTKHSCSEKTVESCVLVIFLANKNNVIARNFVKMLGLVHLP